MRVGDHIPPNPQITRADDVVFVGIATHRRIRIVTSAIALLLVLSASMVSAQGWFVPSTIRVSALFLGRDLKHLRAGGGRLYAHAPRFQSLVMSKDRGHKWEIVLHDDCVPFISVTTPGHIWCGGHTTLHESFDGGTTWKTVPLSEPLVEGLDSSFDWVDESIIIVNQTKAFNIVRRFSKDGGVTFADLPADNFPKNVILPPFRSRNNSLYVVDVQQGGEASLYRLRPLTSKWEYVTRIDSCPDILRQPRLETPSGIWYCGIYAKSEDFGATWTSLAGNVAALPKAFDYAFQAAAIAGEREWYIQGYTTPGVAATVYSLDGGASWQVAGDAEELNRSVEKFVVNPSSPGQLASFDVNGVVLSNDGDRSWHNVWTNPGLRVLPNTAWWFGGATGALIGQVSVPQRFHVIVSHDGGYAFSDARYWDGIRQLGVPDNAYDIGQLSNGNLVMKADWPIEKGLGVILFESSDAGLNWYRKSSLSRAPIFGVETQMRVAANTIWLYSLSNTYRSIDGGNSWIPFLPGFLPNQNLDATSGAVAIHGRFDRDWQLAVSKDAGATYSLIDTRNTLLGKFGGKISIDPYRSDVFYSFSPDYGIVLRSLDGGVHWERFAPFAGAGGFRTMSTVDGRTFSLSSSVSASVNVRITYRVPAFPADQAATEFYNVNLGHYFVTASDSETAGIDRGAAGPGWTRTGETWRVWSEPGAGALPVHRFYAAGPNSHFFTIDGAEATTLRKLESQQSAVAVAAGKRFLGWQYEGLAYAASPNEDGDCTAPNLPLYRLYNDRGAQNDSNHRFVTKAALRTALVEQGWKDEGVAMCVQGT